MNHNKVKVTLEKDLRKKLGIRQFPIIKGDVVKVVKGTRRGEGGKISSVDHRHSTVIIEGLNIAKADGKEKEFPINPEKIEITKLDLSMEERVERIRKMAALKHVEVNQEELEQFSAKTEEPAESEPTEIQPIDEGSTEPESEEEPKESADSPEDEAEPESDESDEEEEEEEDDKQN